MIDSHVHFYDAERPEGVEWPSVRGRLSPQMLPGDLLHAAGTLAIGGVVAIETSRRFIDDLWLLELARQTPLVLAAVLNLQPDLPGFGHRLKAARKHPKFRGIRLRPIAEYDLTAARLRASITRVSAFGGSVEFGARSAGEKAAFAALAGEFCDSHWILDHGGHPEPGSSGPDRKWIETMEAIANLPNVFVKVTNPLDGSFATLTNMFGIERLMFGSNWPVCNVPVDYPLVVDAFGVDSDAFFTSNACRAYRMLPDGICPQDV